MHEFLPHDKKQIIQLAGDLKIKYNVLCKRINSLKEGNPMLGHRGCRLGITFPELTIIQTLWRILISDGKVDEYESNLMRRICGLIYFPDKLSAEIKLKIIKELKSL